MTADPTPTAPSHSSSSGRHPLGTVYLFHFDQRYEHAGHYTGWAEDLDHRVAEHQAGRGARLIQVITQAGISFRLARTWPGVTRARERQLKRQGGASRHCPICQEDRKARGLTRRSSHESGKSKPVPAWGQPGQQWAAAVPTRGTRPDRVQAFLELNPGFAGPRGRQWPNSGEGPAAAKKSSSSAPASPPLATTRMPSLPNTGSPPSPAAPSKPASKRASNAAPTRPNIPAPTSWPPALTSGCLSARPANVNPPAGDPVAPDPAATTRSVIVNAELARLVREGHWVQRTSAAGVLGIGAAAFLLSYDALHSLALASGVRPGLARIWPGVLDGFIVVATLTVVAAKRVSRSTWYPWALVVLFSAASVAFNVLHALDQALAPAGWVAALVFAMPPVALVLATHLLLQQGVWRRQHARSATAVEVTAAEDGPPRAAGTSARPAEAAPRQTEPAPTALGATGRPARAVQAHRALADAATRDRARQLYVEAHAAGRKLTGADLGRALGTSDSYGRLLLREFRTSHTAPENVTAREA
jgi:predicted GIY-YIG superfamily endonuclease